MKFVHKDSTDNESGMIQTMAWHQTECKPVPEPMLTKIIWRHMESLALDELKSAMAETQIDQ